MPVDRKALIREYKESRHPAGVYQVRNSVTGKALVAASSDLQAILNRHRWQLQMNVHPNRELQQDWNELGPQAFEFEILDTLTVPSDRPDYDHRADLSALLELWLDKLSPFADRGYNSRPKPRT